MLLIRVIRTVSCFVVALLVAAATVHANPAEYDDAMLKLANARGCMDMPHDHAGRPACRRPASDRAGVA